MARLSGAAVSKAQDVVDAWGPLHFIELVDSYEAGPGRWATYGRADSTVVMYALPEYEWQRQRQPTEITLTVSAT